MPEWLTPPIAVYAVHRSEARGVPRMAAVVAALAEVARRGGRRPPDA
jgi:hypothetical protein